MYLQSSAEQKGGLPGVSLGLLDTGQQSAGQGPNTKTSVSHTQECVCVVSAGLNTSSVRSAANGAQGLENNAQVLK